ncbi:MAG: DUF5020 family protein [Bacteroidales bacterium]|nr:DUF5020 family protein [Bacteroidales bacterium]
MKRNLLLGVGLIGCFALEAQNIQLHYDFGKDRNYLTSTVEMFKPDKFGSTFFFIDMDYDVNKVKGVSMAYWEIARDLKFWEAPFAWHAEYNGGFGQFYTPTANQAYTINDSWLTGATYTWNNADFSKGFAVQALYKYIRDKHDLSFQLTGIWYLHMLDHKISFAGFADFWREDMDFNFDGERDTKFIFLAEPQIWYNFNVHFSLGSEIELANNFGTVKGFKICPTLGVKYEF